MKIPILIIALVQCTSAWAISIDSIPATAGKKHGLHFIQNARSANIAQGLLLTPFLVPGYSPDIQFTLTAGGIISFKTLKKDSLLPRSSVPATITYSSTGAFIASSNWVTFWLHDRLRVNCLLQYRSLKDVYFGVGYANAIQTSYPDSTGYHRSYFVFQVRPLWRLGSSFFAGAFLDYNQNILWDVNPHMAKDPNYRQFGQNIINAGVGGSITFDSRDFPQNAYKGFYLSATYTVYGKTMGANTRFRTLDVDSRLYIPLSPHKIRTLAFNWRSRYEFGQTPFTAMASFGSPFDLRGYRYGQFRDQFSNYGILEYRHKLYFGNNQPSRYGFVLWTALGAIGPEFYQSLFCNSLPNAGIGLRFEIQPRLNVRLDVGYSPSHSGVYFNFPEAF
ncbi:MAG TPA: BamA/TamA family outer membrane protein [Puia sp.]|nr:BamA/TamA family outer membrane protein [Puia sp.]